MSSGLMGPIIDMLARFNIMGIVTLLQGLLTMGLSWMIFYRSETAQLTANDLQGKLLMKVAMDNIIRLRAIESRITDVGDKNQSFANATAGMVQDLEQTILDYEAIRDYCADMENHNMMDRWRNAKQITIQLQEREARAKDPAHLLNLTLSGVFALMEQVGSKPLVDI